VLGTHLISFILSQFFGIYMLIVALIMLIRVRHYRELVLKMKPDSGTILLGGLIGLMLGLFFVGIHNVWIFEPTAFLTLLCWLVLILSVLWLASPERMVVWTRKLCSGSGYYVLSSLMIITGLLLLGRGLYLYATHHMNFFFMPR